MSQLCQSAPKTPDNSLTLLNDITKQFRKLKFHCRRSCRHIGCSDSAHHGPPAHATGPGRPRRLAYTTGQYLDVLRSYSSTYALAPADRAGFLRCLGSLIDGRYGGRIVKRHLTELRVAHLPG